MLIFYNHLSSLIREGVLAIIRKTHPSRFNAKEQALKISSSPDFIRVLWAIIKAPGVLPSA
jgi:hypothetical protein